MKNAAMTYSRAIVSGLLMLLFVPGAVFAQEAEAPAEPGFFMLNQHQCLPAKMPQVREFADTYFVPVMEELTAEGAILGWGILEHGWGDEWNWNFYMITESHAAFVEAWGQFWEKMSARRPNFYEGGLGQWCTAHRDNMYIITAMGGRGQ